MTEEITVILKLTIQKMSFSTPPTKTRQLECPGAPTKSDSHPKPYRRDGNTNAHNFHYSHCIPTI